MQTKKEKQFKALEKLEKDYAKEASINKLSYRAIMILTQINNLNRKLFSK